MPEIVLGACEGVDVDGVVGRFGDDMVGDGVLGVGSVGDAVDAGGVVSLLEGDDDGGVLSVDEEGIELIDGVRGSVLEGSEALCL